MIYEVWCVMKAYAGTKIGFLLNCNFRSNFEGY